MSQKNGDRARFDRQRKARMHNRSRIRELSKAMKPLDAHSEQIPAAETAVKAATGQTGVSV